MMQMQCPASAVSSAQLPQQRVRQGEKKETGAVTLLPLLDKHQRAFVD